MVGGNVVSESVKKGKEEGEDEWKQRSKNEQDNNFRYVFTLIIIK